MSNTAQSLITINVVLNLYSIMYNMFIDRQLERAEFAKQLYSAEEYLPLKGPLIREVNTRSSLMSHALATPTQELHVANVTRVHILGSQILINLHLANGCVHLHGNS